MKQKEELSRPIQNYRHNCHFNSTDAKPMQKFCMTVHFKVQTASHSILIYELVKEG